MLPEICTFPLSGMAFPTFSLIKSHLVFSFLWLHWAACRILVPWPGTEPTSQVVKARSPNHRTAREVSIHLPNDWPSLDSASVCSVPLPLGKKVLASAWQFMIPLRGEQSREKVDFSQTAWPPLLFFFWEVGVSLMLALRAGIMRLAVKVKFLAGLDRDPQRQILQYPPCDILCSATWIVSDSLRPHRSQTVAPQSSTLAWKIPWMEEPGGLQSMGLLRVGHDWATCLSLFTVMHWRRKWQPTPVFLPGESQGRGSLVGCRLWGRTESDTTEVT